MNHLDITVQRTWCGKTRARITGRADGAVIDVTVTGWRRASVVDEARRTFTATAALQLPKGHPMIRALLISVALLVGLPAAAGAPGTTSSPTPPSSTPPRSSTGAASTAS